MDSYTLLLPYFITSKWELGGGGLWHGYSAKYYLISYPEYDYVCIVYKTTERYSVVSNYSGCLKDYISRKF